MVGTGGADDMASKMKKCLAQFQLEDITSTRDDAENGDLNKITPEA